MRLSPAADRAIDRVKCFVKWQADRFDDLGKPEPLKDSVGWLAPRGGDYWIRPDVWRDTIFDGDEEVSVDAARTLRALGFLRMQQDNGNLQAVVMVRNRRSARAYAVRPAILEWKPATPAYKLALLGHGDADPPALTPATPDGHSDLAGKLETAVDAGLGEALAILRLRPETDDRAYQAILRAKTTILGSVLSAQVRVDESRLQARRHDAAMALIAELLERFPATPQG